MYHNSEDRQPHVRAKCMILKSERCRSGRSGTLGKRSGPAASSDCEAP